MIKRLIFDSLKFEVLRETQNKDVLLVEGAMCKAQVKSNTHHSGNQVHE